MFFSQILLDAENYSLSGEELSQSCVGIDKDADSRGVCYSGFNLAPILYVAFYLPDHKNIIFVGLGPNFKVPTSILRFGSPLLEVKKKISQILCIWVSKVAS